jgi:hypothetical protein
VFSIDVSGSVVNSGPSVQVYTTLTPGHVVIPAYHKVTLVITSVTPPYGGGGDLSGGVIWIEGNWVT